MRIRTKAFLYPVAYRRPVQAAGEYHVNEQAEHGNHHSDQDQPEGCFLAAHLVDARKYGQRDGARLPRDVACKHDGRAKFTDGPREGQNDPSSNAARRQRQGDVAKDGSAAPSIHPRRFLPGRIDLLERHAHGLHQ